MFLASTTACATGKNIPQKEKLNFKNYALAVCLGSAFKSDETTSDFNKSANGYMERGNMSLEAYEELRDLVDKWLVKNYPSKHGGQVNSAKCFDLYHSSELTKIFNQYDPCHSKENWISEEDYKESCVN